MTNRDRYVVSTTPVRNLIKKIYILSLKQTESTPTAETISYKKKIEIDEQKKEGNMHKERCVR